VICLLILLNSFLFPNKPLADWAYSFVVWDGYVYVVSDEMVEDVEKEIGHVTKYSDMEGTYSGNFSNSYKKGTKYFSIKGISEDEAIAIAEDDGRFSKATREGKYEGRESGISSLIAGSVIVLFIVILGLYFIDQRMKRK
jgi:hypothetical protein